MSTTSACRPTEVIDLTMDDDYSDIELDYDSDSDSGESFHTATYDIRSPSPPPSDFDLAPRRTARDQRIKAELIAQGITPQRRAIPVSDSEDSEDGDNETVFGDSDRQKRARREDRDRRDSVRSAMSLAMASDIVVDSSPVLGFLMPVGIDVSLPVLDPGPTDTQEELITESSGLGLHSHTEIIGGQSQSPLGLGSRSLDYQGSGTEPFRSSAQWPNPYTVSPPPVRSLTLMATDHNGNPRRFLPRTPPGSPPPLTPRPKVVDSSTGLSATQTYATSEPSRRFRRPSTPPLPDEMTLPVKAGQPSTTVYIQSATPPISPVFERSAVSPRCYRPRTPSDPPPPVLPVQPSDIPAMPLTVAKARSPEETAKLREKLTARLEALKSGATPVIGQVDRVSPENAVHEPVQRRDSPPRNTPSREPASSSETSSKKRKSTSRSLSPVKRIVPAKALESGEKSPSPFIAAILNVEPSPPGETSLLSRITGRGPHLPEKPTYMVPPSIALPDKPMGKEENGTQARPVPRITRQSTRSTASVQVVTKAGDAPIQATSSLSLLERMDINVESSVTRLPSSEALIASSGPSAPAVASSAPVGQGSQGAVVIRKPPLALRMTRNASSRTSTSQAPLAVVDTPKDDAPRGLLGRISRNISNDTVLSAIPAITPQPIQTLSSRMKSISRSSADLTKSSAPPIIVPTVAPPIAELRQSQDARKEPSQSPQSPPPKEKIPPRAPEAYRTRSHVTGPMSHYEIIFAPEAPCRQALEERVRNLGGRIIEWTSHDLTLQPKEGVKRVLVDAKRGWTYRTLVGMKRMDGGDLWRTVHHAENPVQGSEGTEGVSSPKSLPQKGRRWYNGTGMVKGEEVGNGRSLLARMSRVTGEVKVEA